MSNDSLHIERWLREGAGLSVQSYRLPAIMRCWPAAGTQIALSGVRRHPELFPDILPHVEEVFHIRRSRSASRGWQAKLPSKKLQRTVRARSYLEQRMFERCEVDGEIFRYIEQPIVLTYFDSAGQRRKHTPDLYYETAAVRSFVEVKWEADARKPKNEARWPSIAAAINEMGFQYEVLTERHILQEPAADNVTRLLRFRRADPVCKGHEEALKAILLHGPLSIADIIGLLPGASLPSLCRGLVDGWLCTDLAVALTFQSTLRLSGRMERFS